MATPFVHEQTFPADPVTVMGMLKDPEYIRLKCDRTGSLETTAQVEETPDGGCVLTSTRVLPANVPAAARSFVGETLTVTEVQAWEPLVADGTASASVTVDFGAPMTFRATLTLRPDGARTVVRTEGQFKASVPFIGGKIEAVAAEQTERYLAVEETVGQEWLSR